MDGMLVMEGLPLPPQALNSPIPIYTPVGEKQEHNALSQVRA